MNYSDFLLTIFQIDKDSGSYECGCVVEVADCDFFRHLTEWQYCPSCGKKKVVLLDHQEALDMVFKHLAEVDWDAFKSDDGFDFHALFDVFNANCGSKRLVFKWFDDFEVLVDKVYKIRKNMGRRFYVG